MQLETLDWLIIAAFFLVSLAIGLWTSRSAGKSAADFFLSGRNMPWWLLGVSMVATTFSADTPNLVTDLVRGNGVAANWAWWAFLLTGMLTVFVYARLWRRAGVLTDLEFYELRYAGKPAAFLRGFRAVYLGVFFNVVIMATVCVAGIKMGEVLLGIEPVHMLLLTGLVTVIYSSLGGLKGVIFTDFVQFVLAMIGSVAAAIYIIELPEVGSVTALLHHPEVEGYTRFFPDFSDTDALLTLLVLPLAVQWWSVWYPGAEPGGGGYVAQRMLSAKDENHALGATLFFNVAHYALRPWPWLLIALASLVFFPKTTDLSDQASYAADLPVVLQQYDTPGIAHENLVTCLAIAAEEGSAQAAADLGVVQANPEGLEIRSWALIQMEKNLKSGMLKPAEKQSSVLANRELIRMFMAKPTVSMDKLGHDLGYPLMLGHLPAGLLGLVIASLIAALMSTLSTHLNWGASYVVNDVYLRFVRPEASDKQQVNMGRVTTVTLMVLAGLLAMVIETAGDGFQLLLQIGAGTGLIFILRWFWWRINAYTEIAGMIISFLVALVFHFNDFGLGAGERLVAGVVVTTIGWVVVTFATAPVPAETLKAFYARIRPHGKGWERVLPEGYREMHPPTGRLPFQILCMLLGCATVYFALFGMGSLIYADYKSGVGLLAAGVSAGFALWYFWGKAR